MVAPLGALGRRVAVNFKSYAGITATRGSGLTATQRWVFACVSMRAGDDGRCWASLNTLSDDTGLTPRALRNVLRTLVDQGVLERTSSPARTNAYRVREENIPRDPERGSGNRNEVPPSDPERGSGTGTSFPLNRNVVPPQPERRSPSTGTSFRQPVLDPSLDPSSDPGGSGPADPDRSPALPGLLAEPTEAEVRAREHERAEADVEALLGIWGQQVNIALGRVTVSPASYREATRAAARAAIRELGVEIVADGLRFLSESEHERAEFHRENAANGTDKYLTLRWALSDLARLAEFASWQRRPPAPATRDPRYLSDTELGKDEAWANAYRQPPLEPEEPR